MTELKLQPITGPGEYTQRNGVPATVTLIHDGVAIGVAYTENLEPFAAEWDTLTGDVRNDEGPQFCIRPSDPEIEIPDEMLSSIRDSCIEAKLRFDLLTAMLIARVAIAWDRASRPKREPTAAEIMECYRKCYGGTPEVYSDGFRNAIRRAFELAQEQK